MPAMPPWPAIPLPAIPSGYKHRQPASCLVAAILLVIAPRPMQAGSLGEQLAAVAAAARFPSPTRADVRLECSDGCRTRRAVLLGRGDVLYVETKDGMRALVRPGDVLMAEAAHARPAPLDTRLGDTSVLLRDLAVFTPASLALPQLSDDGPAGIVVTSAPAARAPYVLLVHTIDRERRAIVKTQYYTDSIGHLTKIRRDGGFSRVGGHWRPGEITVETFEPAGTTHLKLAWREIPDPPAILFEPAGLERPSGLAWPGD